MIRDEFIKSTISNIKEKFAFSFVFVMKICNVLNNSRFVGISRIICSGESFTNKLFRKKLGSWSKVGSKGRFVRSVDFLSVGRSFCAWGSALRFGFRGSSVDLTSERARTFRVVSSITRNLRESP